MLKKIALILLLIAPVTVFAQKFGHIKTQAIITIMPEYAKAQTDIQTMQKQYEDEIKRASDELQKKFTEYQQEQANLPKNIQEEISAFLPIMKNDCEGMIRDAETLISATNDFVKQLRLFTEKQSDLQNIRAVGYQKIILLK